MTDQNTFIETLNSVKEIIRVAEMPMSENEIMAYFADMELDESQKQLVLAFLSDPENYGGSEENAQEDAKLCASDYEESEDGISENSRVFQMYLEELSMLPTYAKEEREELYKRLLQGDTEMIDTISTIWLEKVLQLARKYLEPKINVEDLVQEGNMALILKLQELCGSMANPDIEKELSKAVEEGITSHVMGVRDEWEMENSMVGKVSLVHEAEKLLTEEKGCVPTIEELADYTKIPEKELAELKDIIEEASQSGYKTE